MKPAEMNMQTVTPFNTDNRGLTPLARQLTGDYSLYEVAHEPEGINYPLGNIEGALAFSLSIALAERYNTSPSPAEVIHAASRQLLSRLGLYGDGLTPEQVRTQGFVIGLMSAMAESLETGTDEQ